MLPLLPDTVKKSPLEKDVTAGFRRRSNFAEPACPDTTNCSVSARAAPTDTNSIIPVRLAIRRALFIALTHTLTIQPVSLQCNYKSKNKYLLTLVFSIAAEAFRPWIMQMFSHSSPPAYLNFSGLGFSWTCFWEKLRQGERRVHV